MKNLLIVESPTKARTIGKYLPEWDVLATVGHIRDLPKQKMGVDLTTFEPEYVVDEEKKKVVSELVKTAVKAKKIMLATDPDREGEAISYHVDWLLKDKKVKGEIVRITFHEITKEAVEEALEHARKIDQNLVDAQQGRRVLDRVVGYTLSPILWRKVRKGLSAGRVQSVAVRLIVEREKEREQFKTDKYYKIYADLKSGFSADLIKVGSENFYVSEKIKLFDGEYTYTKTIYTDKKQADEFANKIGGELVVEKVNGKESLRMPLPPYTTSKLQQAAARKMGWSGKQTMSVAQRLYEQGLITYHRTDSVYLSDKAVEAFRKFIEEKYGKNYLSQKVRVFKNRTKNAQEAHEAIRPTDARRQISEEMDNRERKLYELIWKRAVATQAAAAKVENTTVLLGGGNGTFEAKGVRMLFDGFLKITEEKHEDQILPLMKVGEKMAVKKIETVELQTSPPPRYNDASLVASLEKQGIGRPSTYAPIIATIQLRQYIEKDEGRFKPTALGVAANEFLVKNFPEILSLPFTAGMEEDLDRVAGGKLEWQKMMKDFWGKFEPISKEVQKSAERVKVEVEKTEEKCPECQIGDLVIRLGRFGKFISCNRFPECKYTRQFKEMAGFKCPDCGAEGVVKKTKTGRKFFGCSNYPNCKWAGWKKP